ncbi:M48 family metallopeptidase [Metabacillus sp. JX24]|uniref:M48 family metallopeptidase n=1 Tax=Metabacillus sp. JX24 TaxID=3240759 RepID=UPI00351063BB
MRKWLTVSVLIYFLYGLFVYWYIYMGADSALPAQFQGGSADPNTFMNSRELTLSQDYSKLRDFMFFASAPFEWFIFFVVLVTGFAKKMQRWAESISRFFILQTAVFVFALSLLVTLCAFPLEWLRYKISLSYHITTQTFSEWMKDQLIDFWVNCAFMVLIVAVLYGLIRKFSRKWWLFAWILSVPFSLFLMFIQPVLIDPLYNEFTPLKNKELETKILAIAEEANIPADHVFEVNMSEKTNALNAYVTGIGDNSRIVLWDTTLNKLSEEEILFIMAHEMGHYVMKHIYIGIGGYLVLTLLGLYMINRLMNFSIRRYGHVLKLDGKKQLASLPLFLMLLGMLSFASDPFSNIISRHQEKDADLYAIEMTENPEAAVNTFQELTRAGLSQVNPPGLVKIFRYSHPTILERINYLEEWGSGREE